MSKISNIKTPTEYFEEVKSKRENSTDEALNKSYDAALEFIAKYKVTGQTSAIKKLIFQVETIEKEREVLKLGIDSFVMKDDVLDFIENVSNKVVKIIELERYERDIPDEVIDKLAKVKNLFDKFYVVFTDYTGKIEKQVSKERRDKDPILFGVFEDEKSRILYDKWYFIADWIDEYCDLTLSEMVGAYSNKKNRNISNKILLPEDIKELKMAIEKEEELKIIKRKRQMGLSKLESKSEKKGFIKRFILWMKE